MTAEIEMPEAPHCAQEVPAMTAEIEMPEAPHCAIIIDNDGNLTVNKYCKGAYSALEECWEYVIKYILDYLGENGWNDFLKKVRVGYEHWPPSYGRFSSYSRHPVHKHFDVDDLIELLAEALKYYVAEEDPMQAIAIAEALKVMPYENWEDEPRIQVDPQEEEFSDGTGVGRSETHKLMIQEVEISEWEERTSRETSDPVYFATDTYDYRRDHGFDDLGPSEIVYDVLEALGVKEEDPEFPDEEDLGLPEIDESGLGAFGLLYESEDHPTEVVVYRDESVVKEAKWLAERIAGNTGEKYEITIVRRMTPSELEFITPIEDQPPPKEHRVNDWTALEKTWKDRPDDFEG